MPYLPASPYPATGPRQRWLALAGVLLAALSGLACSESPSGLSCTAEVRPGIILEIRDSVTDLPAALEAFVLARAGAFEDTLRIPGAPQPSSDVVVGAYERAGTYDVLVENPKYLPWSRSAVRVIAGPCHVEPVRLKALLVSRN